MATHGTGEPCKFPYGEGAGICHHFFHEPYGTRVEWRYHGVSFRRDRLIWAEDGVIHIYMDHYIQPPMFDLMNQFRSN